MDNDDPFWEHISHKLNNDVFFLVSNSYKPYNTKNDQEVASIDPLYYKNKCLPMELALVNAKKL